MALIKDEVTIADKRYNYFYASDNKLIEVFGNKYICALFYRDSEITSDSDVIELDEQIPTIKDREMPLYIMHLIQNKLFSTVVLLGTSRQVVYLPEDVRTPLLNATNVDLVTFFYRDKDELLADVLAELSPLLATRLEPRIQAVEEGLAETLVSYVPKTQLATNEEFGIIKPDGVTTEIVEDGIMKSIPPSVFEDEVLFKDVATFEKVIMGTAYRALSADIAEYYDADTEIKPGTLIQFGGDAEITIATNKVNGIVSTSPAYVLNDNTYMKNPTLVALKGRIPVRVIGPVSKYNKLTLSSINGVAIVNNDCEKPIAIALESNNLKDEKLVNCVVSLQL